MPMPSNRAFDFAAADSILAAQRATHRRAQQGPNDRSAIRNERIKLSSSFLNALGVTLIAFALLRPITQDLSALTPLSFFWVGLGVALHFGAHVILGRLSEADAPERD